MVYFPVFVLHHKGRHTYVHNYVTCHGNLKAEQAPSCVRMGRMLLQGQYEIGYWGTVCKSSANDKCDMKIAEATFCPCFMIDARIRTS